MLKVTQKTAAEGDKYLFECFEESTFIADLLENDYSIVLGRKGSGKTALAKYLQEKYFEHGITFAYRISIIELSSSDVQSKDAVESIIFFILTKTVQLMLEKGHFSRGYTRFWEDFLLQNGLQDLNDYKTFVEWTKTNHAEVSLKVLNSGVGGNFDKQFQRTPISNSTGNLFAHFQISLVPTKKCVVFIDDISDYLDQTNSNHIEDSIEIIRDVVLRLDKFNCTLQEKHQSFSFITCLREDLFEKMSGSNLNKLENTALKLNWSEKSFCKLIIRRVPFFEDNIDLYLEDPIKSIAKFFPNQIFAESIKEAQTKGYSTGFYSYMMAISFNRPRDFLKFCYCMKDRLSVNEPVSFASIQSAEIEYSDYMFKELKDELDMVTSLESIKNDIEGIKKLLYSLSKLPDFSYGFLKSEMGKIIVSRERNNSSSNSKIIQFLKDLWDYGLIGYVDKSTGKAAFKYYGYTLSFLSEADLKKYSFVLHRGIKWALKKY